MKTVVVLQPGYLPWLGFFNQLQRCDAFVYYDDVQYDKHGWRNRNRIKTPAGPSWLTVPAMHRGKNKPRILEVEITPDSNWAHKHLGTLNQFYKNAPFAKRYLPGLAAILERPWGLLVDLNLTVTAWLCDQLQLKREAFRSSELGIGGDKSERLVNICRHLGAGKYLSGNAAKDYLDVDLFARNDIIVEWQDFEHPAYPQLHGEFIPFLSVIDLLLNVGPESQRYIL